MLEAILFWVFAALALLGAISMASRKNPIHAALSLVGTLFCTAALYILLKAGFLAVMQVLVYAGAIMVLFVFVIMMLNLQKEEFSIRHHALKKALAIALALLVAAKFIEVYVRFPQQGAVVPQDFGSIERVGMLLLTDMVLPFEAVSILLLVAIVGAVMISKTKV